jgi:ferredoxin
MIRQRPCGLTGPCVRVSSFALWRLRNRKLPRLTHASGRVMPILAGASVLETLRQQGVPHAALCGGRARCTTCRVLVTKGGDQLPPPSGLEADALARIGATPGMRSPVSFARPISSAALDAHLAVRLCLIG